MKQVNSKIRLFPVLTFTLLLVSTLIAAASDKPTDSAPKPTEPLVSIAKGASQEAALEALHRSTGKLVLSECPKVEHRSKGGIAELPLTEALPVFTANYHLHALAGERELLFVRRFWDPCEEPDIPVEEITAIVTDVHRLIDAVSPHFEGRRGDYERQAFYLSLTPEQLARARREELTYAMLLPEQRKQWGVLTAAYVFNSPEYELRTSVAIYRNWSQCDTRWSSVAEPDMVLPSLRFRYPIQTEERLERYEFELLRPRPGFVPPAPEAALGSVETLEYEPRGRASCREAFRPVEQPATLGEIVEGIAKDNQVEIRVPTYARERRYHLYAAGYTGNAVLKGLAAINGWEIYQTGKRSYALDRPRFLRTGNYRELFRNLRTALPPVVRTLLEAPGEEGDSRRALQHRSWGILQDYLERRQKWYSGFQIADLDAEQQRRLANLILLGRGLRGPVQFLLPREPPASLVSPERGFFRLKGEEGPGKRPSLDFFIIWTTPPTKPGEGPRTWVHSWGWLVNPSSLGY
jgi:hypothetical protein